MISHHWSLLPHAGTCCLWHYLEVCRRKATLVTDIGSINPIFLLDDPFERLIDLTADLMMTTSNSLSLLFRSGYSNNTMYPSYLPAEPHGSFPRLLA